MSANTVADGPHYGGGEWFAVLGVEAAVFFFAFLVTGLTSFGSSIIVHLSFAVAFSLSGVPTFSSLSSTVASLVLVALIMIPTQAWLLRKRCSWTLCACLSPAILVFSVVGAWVVTTYGDERRDEMLRALGAGFLLFALWKVGVAIAQRRKRGRQVDSARGDGTAAAEDAMEGGSNNFDDASDDSNNNDGGNNNDDDNNNDDNNDDNNRNNRNSRNSRNSGERKEKERGEGWEEDRKKKTKKARKTKIASGGKVSDSVGDGTDSFHSDTCDDDVYSILPHDSRHQRGGDDDKGRIRGSDNLATPPPLIPTGQSNDVAVDLGDGESGMHGESGHGAGADSGEERGERGEDGEEPWSPSYPINTWKRAGCAVFVGACSGFFAGLFGVGGPPLMVYRASVPIDALEARATMAMALALVLPIQAGFIFGVQGKFEHDRVFNYLAIVVTSFAGLVLGNVLAPRMTPVATERLIVGLLFASSIVMLTNGDVIISSSAIGGVALVAAVTYLLISRSRKGERERERE